MKKHTPPAKLASIPTTKHSIRTAWAAWHKRVASMMTSRVLNDIKNEGMQRIRTSRHSKGGRP